MIVVGITLIPQPQILSKAIFIPPMYPPNSLTNASNKHILSETYKASEITCSLKCCSMRPKVQSALNVKTYHASVERIVYKHC